jgi:hypothetical protein
VLCDNLILWFPSLCKLLAGGREPSGSLALAATPDGLRRSATTRKVSCHKALKHFTIGFEDRSWEGEAPAEPCSRSRLSRSFALPDTQS